MVRATVFSVQQVEVMSMLCIDKSGYRLHEAVQLTLLL
jgi:hypothetical protein